MTDKIKSSTPAYYKHSSRPKEILRWLRITRVRDTAIPNPIDIRQSAFDTKSPPDRTTPPPTIITLHPNNHRPSPVTYGISGNITKQEIWQPIGTLVAWLLDQQLPFVLETAIASGLVKRDMLSSEDAETYSHPNLPQASDVILSFGGDGTLLSTAHNVGAHQTPILGVNLGRLGFLADTEVSNLNDTIRRLEKGAYRIEERMVLEARFEGQDGPEVHWALNDFVLERSLMPQLISVEVCVDGAPLTTYWADGLIISTPTGSTAYALSVGGPILAPGSDVMVLTPIAPHTLTVRPLVLPASAIITADVQASNFVFAADGRSTSFEGTSPQFSIKRAQHSVRLIKLPEQDYFQTLRSKLRWSGR